MSEQNKLTEERLQLDSQHGWKLSPDYIYDILSNQEKAESYDFLFKHGELIKKKFDSLEQENKRLKEDKQKQHDENLKQAGEIIDLKQKLEKIKERFNYLKSLQSEDMSAEDLQEYRILKEIKRLKEKLDDSLNQIGFMHKDKLGKISWRKYIIE